ERASWARPRVVVLALVGVLAVTAVVAGAVLRPDDAPLPRAAVSPTSLPSSPAPRPPATSAAPSPRPTVSPTPRAAGAVPDVRRLRADDLYGLSALASRSTVGSGTTAPVAYLVGDDAVDLGWAAVPAAAARGGVLLLTDSDRLSDATATELRRVRASEVVVVGDTRAVSDAVVTAARRLVPAVVRVDVADPVTASRELSRSAFPTAPAAWVAAADSGPDLAVAAAAAAARRAPLLVVDGAASAFPAPDLALLEAAATREVTVVGDAEAVSADVEAGLVEALGTTAVSRATGENRAVTAARVHQLARGGAAPAQAVLADPDRASDSLTAAFLAGRTGAPLLWAGPLCLASATRTAVLAPTVARVTIVGGEGAARGLVERFEPCRSLTDPASPWVLVNKANPLAPQSFAPDDLVEVPMPNANGQAMRREAATALARMTAASAQEGAGVVGIDTAYRSYATQDELYDGKVAERGRAWTDRWYLRPGYSEHQTGLTVDLLPVGRSNCSINDCIDETPQGVWLARHSWRFGFILRYERGETGVTGVGFEPWHFRYVGTALAAAYHDGGWDTYEEFLGEPAAPTY
ncbi:MAG: D-alanyl-D-alanine carboxypeptidase family protein, partial [Phycicoccus sp.]